MPPTNVLACVMNPFAISHWQVGGLVLVRYSLVNLKLTRFDGHSGRPGARVV